MTKAEELEARATPAILKLPNLVLEKMFGPPSINDRGAPLDLQTHALVQLMRLTKKPELSEIGVQAARRIFRFGSLVLDMEPLELHEVHDIRLEGGVGSIPARVYRPSEGELPCVVFFHGGGFTIGSIDTHDALCRFLADRLDAVIVNVGYRLAPEHPYPAAIEDAYQAFVGVCAQSRELGIDRSRVGVMGDSAGGNLSAVISQHCIDTDHPKPAFQVLIYPGCDFAERYPSKDQFRSGFYLTTASADWFFDTYLHGFDDPHNPSIAPLRYERLGDMPPTYVITAGFDPLRDEGEAYAAALRDAGVHVIQRSADQLVHGFAGMGGVIKAARHQLEDLCVEVRREFLA